MNLIISWLTEDDDPYVKYLTYKNILGKKTSKKDFSKIVASIADSEPASSILNLQDKKGWWGKNTHSFNPLYKNTFWQLFFLAKLGINREIDGIDRAVELTVTNMQDKNGSFPSDSRNTGVLPCMQGITLEMILRLGYGTEKFTRRLISFINRSVYDDSFRCKYRQNLRCPWGAVKILRAYKFIPGRSDNEKTVFTRKKASEFLVRYNIVEANYPRRKNRSKHWRVFGFPRSYQSDILEVAFSIVDAGCSRSNKNLKNALEYIYSRRLPDGRWKMDFSLNGRMLVDIERKNKPSKWITYFALKTLYKSKFLDETEKNII